MTKKLVRFTFVFVAYFASVASTHAAEPPKECAEYAAYGMPGTDGTLLCRMGFLLAHDDEFLTPIWVAERLTKERALGGLPRKDNYRADAQLPKGKRAELADYAGSGFDRGHAAPSGNMRWHEQAMAESCYLSNIVPQNSHNNRQIWAALEAHIRDWAMVRGELVVYTGTVYDNEEANMTIGKSNVGVPDRLYKVVYDVQKKEAIAFLLPNQPIDSKHLKNYIVSVREIESITGLNFLSALPRKEQNRIEKTKADMWPRN